MGRGGKVGTCTLLFITVVLPFWLCCFQACPLACKETELVGDNFGNAIILIPLSHHSDPPHLHRPPSLHPRETLSPPPTPSHPPPPHPQGRAAAPSLRYIELIRAGAAEYGLAPEYCAFLAAVEHYRCEGLRARLGRLVFSALGYGLLTPVFLPVMRGAGVGWGGVTGQEVRAEALLALSHTQV
jgi:hypothetical protein